MYALVLAALLAGPQITPPPGPPSQQIVQIPPATDELNVMFVASKGDRKYRVLTLPAFQKELSKCIMLHTEFFDTPQGPLVVFRCEESK